MIAAAAFMFGIAVQVQLLGSALEPDPFDPLLLTYAALTVLAIGYITLRAERKYGLIDPYDDSINIIEVAFSLPTWARVVSFIIVCYIVFLYLVGSNANTGLAAALPEEFSVLKKSLPANGLAATFASLFLFSSFVIAAYLLARKPIKDFH
jgi:hypothetical protein